jgi:hypothetical protein
MESLKKLSEVSEADPRQALFSRIDPSAPDFFRARTLGDVHALAEAITLNSAVPPNIRDHFETARNLIVYSWFYYPFNVTAQLAAYVSVEYALRERMTDRTTNFGPLLTRAVQLGIINDQGFSIPSAQLKRIREWNAELPPEMHLAEPSSLSEYSKAIAADLPRARNSLAHGTTTLHHMGASTVALAAEIINQLFPANP